ncbi:GtrA family protein, partial [Serratia marcescens]|uniref:GtrA family protein n=1 Tax=Serratia marcescens TaxID=615 RepID=UPI001953C41D
VYLGLVHLTMRASVAAVAGYGAGLALHFLLSARVAFDGAATRKSAARLFWQFALSGVCGLVVTAVTVALLADYAGVRPILAKAAAVALS